MRSRVFLPIKYCVQSYFERSLKNVENSSLQQLRIEIWGPFVFVCSDPDIEPLSHYYGDLFDYFQRKIDLTEIAFFGNMEEIIFETEANWKVVVENSLECYHWAHAHPGLASSIDLRQFEQWAQGWWSAQQAPQKIIGKKRGAALGKATYESSKVSGMDSARFNFLFPNLYISVWPGSLGFSTTEITPKGHHRTETRHRRFFHSRKTVCRQHAIVAAEKGRPTSTSRATRHQKPAPTGNTPTVHQ